MVVTSSQRLPIIGWVGGLVKVHSWMQNNVGQSSKMCFLPRQGALFQKTLKNNACSGKLDKETTSWRM